MRIVQVASEAHRRVRAVSRKAIHLPHQKVGLSKYVYPPALRIYRQG